MKDFVYLDQGRYRGWTLGYSSTAPVTGRWKATRYGVSMCANDKPLILRMIDAKANESNP